MQIKNDDSFNPQQLGACPIQFDWLNYHRLQVPPCLGGVVSISVRPGIQTLITTIKGGQVIRLTIAFIQQNFHKLRNNMSLRCELLCKSAWDIINTIRENGLLNFSLSNLPDPFLSGSNLDFLPLQIKNKATMVRFVLAASN